jgi:SAM-dependent methyltransferase
MNAQVIKQFLKSSLSANEIDRIKRYRVTANSLFIKSMFSYGRYVKTPLNLINGKKRQNRRLEIGPGAERIAGFETVNVVWGKNVDYVADASKKLPFKNNTFELVYASHILEHIPWYSLKPAIKEWVRIVSPGGAIEIWVPNGLLIAKTFVDAEEGTVNNIGKDGWYKLNDEKDPCIWANGRIFSYGDGTGNKNDPNWHLTIFSPRFLKKLLEDAGLVEIESLTRTEVRGHDHGWINLGFRGRKL